MMSLPLDGRHALVTGGATGIGAAIVQRLVADGARVVAAGRRRDVGEQFVAGLRPGVEWRTLDVRQSAAWEALVDEFADDPFEVLVNNAGGLQFARRLHELTPLEWEEEIGTNLSGAFFGMRAVLPPMISLGRGVIVNIGSISGVRAQDDAAGYQAAKGGLHMLSRHAAIAYARHGIRVNCVDPGAIRTVAVDRHPSERLLAFLSKTPMHREGAPADVAAVVSFLVSDEASFVTGADYSVDGGYLA